MAAAFAPYAWTPYEASLIGLDTRLHALLPHANGLGPVMLLYLVAEYAQPSRPWVRWGVGGTAVLLLVLAQSKTAWAAAVVAGVVLWAGRSRRGAATRLVASGMIVLTCVGLVALTEDAAEYEVVAVEQVESLRTLTGRTALWAYGLDVWRSAPIFGAGSSASPACSPSWSQSSTTGSGSVAGRATPRWPSRRCSSYERSRSPAQAYGMHASNGILFNHESERRGETFVTRKITRAATRIKLGLQDVLYLGNLDAERDWGHARDFVRAMWLMLQQDEPDDYVIATGERHSVREFCQAAFGLLDLDWSEYVQIDERYLRPAEVDLLEGDASKARKVLGWEPEVGFEQLVSAMVEADLALARKERTLVDAGHEIVEWRSGRPG